VKLFGLLEQYVAGYNATKGITVETDEGAAYRDLIGLLRLPPGEVGLFSVAGIIRQPDDPIADCEEVSIFMPLAGG
jgi:hypothetical protein